MLRRDYDKTMFASGGLFEHVTSSDPTSQLPPPVAIRDPRNLTYSGETKYSQNELLDLINKAESRPTMSRLAQLTYLAREKEYQESQKGKLMNRSISEILNDTRAAVLSNPIDIFNDYDKLMHLGFFIVIVSILILVLNIDPN